MEKFNSEGGNDSHIQGFEYIIELRNRINDNLKEKYFGHSLFGEARKCFHTLELESIIFFKNNFKCNILRSLGLSDLITCKRGGNKR